MQQIKGDLQLAAKCTAKVGVAVGLVGADPVMHVHGNQPGVGAHQMQQRDGIGAA